MKATRNLLVLALFALASACPASFPGQVEINSDQDFAIYQDCTTLPLAVLTGTTTNLNFSVLTSLTTNLAITDIASSQITFPVLNSFLNVAIRNVTGVVELEGSTAVGGSFFVQDSNIAQSGSLSVIVNVNTIGDFVAQNHTRLTEVRVTANTTGLIQITNNQALNTFRLSASYITSQLEIASNPQLEDLRLGGNSGSDIFSSGSVIISQNQNSLSGLSLGLPINKINGDLTINNNTIFSSLTMFSFPSVTGDITITNNLFQGISISASGTSGLVTITGNNELRSLELGFSNLIKKRQFDGAGSFSPAGIILTPSAGLSAQIILGNCGDIILNGPTSAGTFEYESLYIEFSGTVTNIQTAEAVNATTIVVNGVSTDNSAGPAITNSILLTNVTGVEGRSGVNPLSVAIQNIKSAGVVEISGITTSQADISIAIQQIGRNLILSDFDAGTLKVQGTFNDVRGDVLLERNVASVSTDVRLLGNFTVGGSVKLSARSLGSATANYTVEALRTAGDVIVTDVTSFNQIVFDLLQCARTVVLTGNIGLSNSSVISFPDLTSVQRIQNGGNTNTSILVSGATGSSNACYECGNSNSCGANSFSGFSVACGICAAQVATTSVYATTTQLATTTEYATTTQPATTTVYATTQPPTTTVYGTSTQPVTTTVVYTTTQPPTTTVVYTTTQPATTTAVRTTSTTSSVGASTSSTSSPAGTSTNSPIVTTTTAPVNSATVVAVSMMTVVALILA